MSVQPSALKREMPHLVAWIVVFPALVAWPFLSVLPFFGLGAPSASALQITVDILLLATGFWPVVIVASGYRIWQNAIGGGAARPAGQIGLILGAIATVWTILYLIAAIAGR